MCPNSAVVKWPQELWVIKMSCDPLTHKTKKKKKQSQVFQAFVLGEGHSNYTSEVSRQKGNQLGTGKVYLGRASGLDAKLDLE